MLAPTLLRVDVWQLDLVLLDNLAILRARCTGTAGNPERSAHAQRGAGGTERAARDAPAERRGDDTAAERRRTSSNRMKRVEDVPWSTLPTSLDIWRSERCGGRRLLLLRVSAPLDTKPRSIHFLSVAQQRTGSRSSGVPAICPAAVIAE